MSRPVESGQYMRVSYPSAHIAHVELCREPVNSFNDRVWTEYGQVFDKISLDATVRVVVLSSALPKLFTAGLDLQSGAQFDSNEVEQDPARRALQWRDYISRFQYAISATERCPYPVIVAVHGHALGLGIDIMSACDIRYASSDAIFSIKEIDIGLAADIGSLARVPKVTGNESLVRELAFTARNFSAEEAKTIGLVSKVVQGSRDQVVAAALEMAKVISVKSPVAVIGTKRLLLHSRDHSVDENLDYTLTWNSAMLQTQDIIDAFAAFKSKKRPNFAPIRKASAKPKL